jgi:hypothetical protein
MPKVTFRDLFAVVTISAALMTAMGCKTEKVERVREGVRDAAQHAREIENAARDQPSPSK